MSNEIQQTRYDHLVRRVGGIIGPGSKVAEVLTELFPTLDVENVPGELLFLSGWQMGFGGGEEAPGVGNRQKWQLVNPVGSGLLCVVTRVEMSCLVSSTLTMTLTDTLFVSSPGTETKRDTREGVGQTFIQVREEASAAVTSPNYVVRIASNQRWVLEDPNGVAVLSPGFALEVGLGAPDNLLAAGFFWRARVAEPSELAF